MRARAFFNSSKLMLPGVVIGATFSPGFSYDLSSWRLGIDDEGNLFQDTQVWQWTEETGIVKERRQQHVQIGVEAVLALLLKAEELGFHSYQPVYNASIDDMPAQLISIRFGERETTVDANGVDWSACQGNRDMKGFAELWRIIHHHAPFPEKSSG